MDPFQWEETCSVCGGKAMAREPTPWDRRYKTVHTNPEVCRDVLARKAEELTKREEALKEKENA